MNTSAIYTAIINIIYPVGTVIQNYKDNTNPGDRIPGTTWKKLEDVFLVGEGSFGSRNFEGGTISSLSTGGEATVALTPDNLPEHNHILEYDIGNAGGWNTAEEHKQVVFEKCHPTNNTNLTKIEGSTYTTSTTGDNNYRHNNIPPYTKVYGWYRTA